MAVARDASFEQAVDVYLSANDSWLSDSETPLVTSLVKIGLTLDAVARSGKALTSTLAMEFRMVFVELDKRRPADEVPDGDTDGFGAGIRAILDGA